MNMAGSKLDIPKELFEQIRFLEDLFTVDTKKLKEITDHFITELDKGMQSSLRRTWASTDTCVQASALRGEVLYGISPPYLI